MFRRKRYLYKITYNASQSPSEIHGMGSKRLPVKTSEPNESNSELKHSSTGKAGVGHSESLKTDVSSIPYHMAPTYNINRRMECRKLADFLCNTIIEGRQGKEQGVRC